MAGMPVYGIVSVHINNGLMTRMVIGPYSNGEMLARVERNRDWLIQKLGEGELIICTVHKNQSRWEIPEDVNVISINGQKFLRIDKNSVAEDYLGGVSQF